MAKIDDETRDRVVEQYQAGTRIQDISADTGVKRPTIYYILRQRGLRPTRTARNVDGPDLAELMQQLNAAQRELGKWQFRAETAEARLAELGE